MIIQIGPVSSNGRKETEEAEVEKWHCGESSTGQWGLEDGGRSHKLRESKLHGEPGKVKEIDFLPEL